VDRGHAGCRHVVGTEWQRRHAPHFHLLLADCSQLSIPEAVADWRELAGDALIVPYDRRRGGAPYYISKVYGPHGRGELDFGGEWSSSAASKLSDMRRRA